MNRFIQESIRNKKKKPLSFIINFIGMSIALTAVIIIFQYVRTQLEHDKGTFTKDMQQVVRCEMGVEKMGSITPAALSYFVGEMPEVEASCQLMCYETIIATQDASKKMKLQTMIVDSSVFEVLPYKFYVGNPKNAIETMDKCVISRSAAKKLFGNEHSAQNSIITMNGFPIEITAIIEDTPSNSTYKADVICNRDIIQKIWGYPKSAMKVWGNWNCDAIARLKEGVNIEEFNKKYQNALIEQLALNGGLPKDDVTNKPEIRRFEDCYFTTNLTYTHANTKDLFTIKILIALGVLILAISIINYVNIYTARSSEVIRSMGIKAIFGAEKGSLIKGIILDTILLVFICSIAGYGIALSLKPLLPDIFGEQISLGLDLLSALIIFIFAPAIIGLISSIYPAIALTRLKPLDAIARRTTSSEFNYIRNTLIVFQFTISIVLIASTIYINKQMNYVSNMNLGINRDNILVVTGETFMMQQFPTFREQLLKNPSIKNASFMKQSPINIGEFTTQSYGPGKDDQLTVNILMGDENTFEVLGLKMIEGEMPNYLSLREGIDGRAFFIINETMAKILKGALGDDLVFPYKNYAGVMNDFQAASIDEPIGPIVFTDLQTYSRGTMGSAYIKIDGENLSATLAYIEKVFEDVYPKELYQSHFLDREFNEMYKDDKLWRTRLLAFSLLAIIIGCLGLFALVSYSIERRRKEIGIRKVYGASITQMVNMLLASYIKWLIISFAIATPIIWYCMKEWVSQYVYQAELNWWIFVLAALLTTLIAISTVIFQTYIAASTNPSKAVKGE